MGRDIRLTRLNAGKRVITKHGCRLIEEAAAGGLSKKAIAARLGIGASTFNDILKRDPKAHAAFEEGLAANENELVSLLMTEARGDGPKANTARIFLLKTRHGFREIGQGADDSKPIINITIPPAMSPAELESFINQRATIDAKALDNDD